MGDKLHIMSGVEFETWVVKVLKENGFDDVRGTPATGDQGVDIIAKRNGRTINRYYGLLYYHVLDGQCPACYGQAMDSCKPWMG
jgi:hypothetical protein